MVELKNGMSVQGKASGEAEGRKGCVDQEDEAGARPDCQPSDSWMIN